MLEVLGVLEDPTCLRCLRSSRRSRRRRPAGRRRLRETVPVEERLEVLATTVGLDLERGPLRVPRLGVAPEDPPGAVDIGPRGPLEPPPGLPHEARDLA